jgi:hypothetical protein
VPEVPARLTNNQKKLWRQLEEERSADSYPGAHEFRQKADTFLGRRDTMTGH